jgi:outer membrane protein TolC
MYAFFVTPQQKPATIQHGEESLFEFAIQNRLDLATQRAIIEQRAAELGIANPPLVTGSFMFNENFGDRKAVLPGGGITIALDGDAKEAAADATLKQAELQYVDAMRTVIHDVRALFETYTTAINKLAVDEESLHIAETSFQRALEANKQGELNPLSLLPMQRSVIQAKQELLSDELLVSINTIKLEQAVGGSFKGMNQ